jgi:hypothetical protein
MNANDAERTDGPGGEYAALHLGDAAVIIYDRDDHRAWVQSDLAVRVDGMA